MRYKINILSIYEKGHYRETQEDNIYPPYNDATKDDRLFMVCDGMGGHEAGEVASQAVCEAMSRVIQKLAPGEKILTNEILDRALTEAYDLLDERDPNPESVKKMGTTMTLLKLHDKGATIAHIGDSRVYQLRPDKEGKMQVVHKTRDHSLVNDLLKAQELTEEEAKNFPRKNVITRAMQSHLERRPKADVTQIEDVRAGDYFLLCSDGILEHTSDENLCYMIGMPEADDEKKVKMLQETTDDNKDNHSAYLIHILEAEGPAQAHPNMTPVQQEQSPSGRPAARQAGKNGSVIRYLAMGISSLLVIGGAWLYTTTDTKTGDAKPPLEEESVNETPATTVKPQKTVPDKVETPQKTGPITTDTLAQAAGDSAATKPTAVARPEAEDQQAEASHATEETTEAEAVSNEGALMGKIQQTITASQQSSGTGNH